MSDPHHEAPAGGGHATGPSLEDAVRQYVTRQEEARVVANRVQEAHLRSYLAVAQKHDLAANFRKLAEDPGFRQTVIDDVVGEMDTHYKGLTGEDLTKNWRLQDAHRLAAFGIDRNSIADYFHKAGENVSAQSFAGSVVKGATENVQKAMGSGIIQSLMPYLADEKKRGELFKYFGMDDDHIAASKKENPLEVFLGYLGERRGRDRYDALRTQYAGGGGHDAHGGGHGGH